MKRKYHATPGRLTVMLSCVAILLLAACQAGNPTALTTPGTTPQSQAKPTQPPDTLIPVTGSTPSTAPTGTAEPRAVPDFSHVIIFIMENKEYTSIIGNTQMPFLNSLAKQYTLLTNYHAIAHPSLPNYIALIGGDTLGISTDCNTCWVNAPNLADSIEGAGLTWRTYQESMPGPCYLGSNNLYAQRHDPFIYFDNIRTNAARCKSGIVPLTQLDDDLANNKLPNFSLIVPNMCNSSHDCALSKSDAWLKTWVNKVMASKAYDDHTLIVLTWDEGQSNQTCCGLTSGGGRVATVLVSPLVRQGFRDNTPYTHYSLLKTIEESWGLQKLAQAANQQEDLITAPFERVLSYLGKPLR